MFVLICFQISGHFRRYLCHWKLHGRDELEPGARRSARRLGPGSGDSPGGHQPENQQQPGEPRDKVLLSLAHCSAWWHQHNLLCVFQVGVHIVVFHIRNISNSSRMGLNCQCWLTFQSSQIMSWNQINPAWSRLAGMCWMLEYFCSPYIDGTAQGLLADGLIAVN